MVTLDKMLSLAKGSRFDSTGPEKNSAPDLEKIYALGDATKHDICVSSASSRKVTGLDRIGDVAKGGICHSFSHDGRCVSMFKTLFTNECKHQCAYCSNSTTCKKHHAKFSYEPHELANLFMKLYLGNYVEGLFLSSGIGDDEHRTMEQMIESTRILRERHKFAGYVHLKILPGADKEHIAQAVELADRVSVNIEVPDAGYMDVLSPTKDYDLDILRRQRYIKGLEKRRGLPAGQTTQFVIGGASESDREVFDSVLKEYDDMKLKRVYYSSFLPVEGTALEENAAQPTWREHRLYQIDWLYRVYKLEDREISLAFNENDNLPNTDPKVTIARETMDSPIDPNLASYGELLRVPGIGPISARRIISTRRSGRIRTRKELHYLGVRTKRAAPFIKLGGWQDSLLERWIN
ncbi:MAG TPA: putative DNA modification/repair radical SAM protein [Candidatus Methanofastidiosa archaeon]|nr:putative DNA modification/repair radical SAM protein [Candidatus Methanofastidiosa archaeon]HPR41092.1 putative DNA modification/repair radical SAM protein [Candidatus Methanofastidiosa archaeon]